MIVHRRYNALLLPCLEGPISSLNDRVQSFFKKFPPSSPVTPLEVLQYIERAITGICAHIAALDLFMPGSCAHDSLLERQRKGIAFFTRAPPETPANPLHTYRGHQVNDRIEALVCAGMLTMLCAAAGYRPNLQDLKLGYEALYRPYYRESFDKNPDRRSCAQLSAATQNFRAYQFCTRGKPTFKPIFETPIGPAPAPKRGKAKGKAKQGQHAAPGDAYFSLSDFHMRAGLPNDGETHPAAMTLSWFAARIKKFASTVQ